MHFLAFATLAFAASATASIQSVQNACHEDVWLTFANSTWTGTSNKLGSGEAFVSNLAGTGDSLGVTKNESAYW
jgi:hypothetical protein